MKKSPLAAPGEKGEQLFLCRTAKETAGAEIGLVIADKDQDIPCPQFGVGPRGEDGLLPTLKD